jgi:ribosomal protein S18 acetylase RimI-like enzyme
LATADDAELAGFRCSTGPWYEHDVESFVRERALARLLNQPEDYRLLLALEGDRLLCCMAHEGELLLMPDDNTILAARLQLLGIAVQDQGRRLDGGSRLSDKLMSTLIEDALEHVSTHVITAIVASDNLRSMALCERHGLRSQIRYDARHVRLSGLCVSSE